MLRKLRVKFVLITMAVVSVMLCTIVTMIYHSTKLNLENNGNDLLQRIAESPMQPGRPGEFGEDANIPHFTLELGKNGEILAVTGSYYDLSNEGFLQQIVEEVSKTAHKSGDLPEYDLRFQKGGMPGKQRVAFVDTSHEKEMLRSLLTSSVLIGMLCWLALLGVSVFFARWAVKPVERAWQQQRQFISDASHELKTPLTVIMTNAQMLQNTDNTEEDRHFLFGNILTMSRQMQKLLEQMLELARSDNMQQVSFSLVDLSALTEDAALLFEPVFFDREMVLENQIQLGITVEGSEVQLRQMLEIFLDNAQKYATPGGKTTVSLAKVGRNKCVLTVFNEGPSIPQEHLENLFKRFYRADQARTRNGSFGLGLSIAQSIAQRHKGKIWAESADGVNSFSVELSIVS